MAKTISKKRKTKERVIVSSEYASSLCTLNAEVNSRISRSTPPRWRILPPDVIRIIIELLKDDEATLRACSFAAREFSQPALSRIGRHITLNHATRIKQCARLLTTNSAFQHVRSLDIGLTSKGSNPEGHLEEQLTILGIFARRQSLTRLWLSNIPFPSIESSQRSEIRDVVAALSSTINDLGLYECRFPSYVDIISFVGAFLHCDSLYIRDCIIDDKNLAGNIFSGFPKHKLSLNVLELSSALSNKPIIDVSSMIEDAGMDVSKLSALTCNVGSAQQARSVAMATSASPIQHFQLACAEPGGFRGTFDSIPNCPGI